MNPEKPKKLGVIEGFFGKPWSWEARKKYANFLSQQDFNAYLYAPKSDTYLRKNWQQAFPNEHFKNLENLSAHYAAANIDFGIGLSPFELYRDFNTVSKTHLSNKLSEINNLSPSTLCILFDDMQGDFPNLAQQQADIINFVSEKSQAKHLIMCPTYYSYDPMLATHFGEPPKNYLEDLGQLIDPEIDIFWTGSKVISPEYPKEHLIKVSQKLQRKPLLWDNYPVNDGKNLTDFLHLRPPPYNAPELMNNCNGHMANPMNQAFLSQLPLHGLSQKHQGSEADTDSLFEQACLALCPQALAEKLISDVQTFQDLGLEQIDQKLKTELIAKYSLHLDNPIAQEIVDWLNNQYAFDPACLT